MKLKQIFSAAFLFVVLTATSQSFSQSSKNGKWEEQNKSISGYFKIQKSGGETYVVLSDDFKTKSAPDLKIFLSKKKVSDITGKNATKDAALVAKLKSNKGSQKYKLPSNVKLADYTSLIIHCEQYSIFWGGGTIPN